MSKTTAQIIIYALGADTIAGAVGVTISAVYQASGKGVMPPAWWPIVRDMCAARGIDCPEHAFGWRKRGDKK